MRRAPDGSMMVIFTILSKTDGGPLAWALVAGATAGAAAMVRTEVLVSLLVVGMAERAKRKAEVNMAMEVQ